MNSNKMAYENVSLHDDAEDSNTEVDESLIGDEKPWHGTRRSKRQTCWSLFNSYRWMIDTFLLLVITSLLLLLRQEWASHGFPKSSYQVGGDFTGAGPHFDTKIVKFEQNMSFIPMDPPEFFSNKTLDTWKTMMPAGTGWGQPGEAFFTTAMTHQLHCVFMMGKIFNGVVMNTTTPLPDHFLPDDWHWHFLHCIEYLRQSITCSADVAVEPHEANEAGETGPLAIDAGWNAHHVCKDYGQVIDYLEGQISDGVRVVLPIDD